MMLYSILYKVVIVIILYFSSSLKGFLSYVNVMLLKLSDSYSGDVRDCDWILQRVLRGRGHYLLLFP